MTDAKFFEYIRKNKLVGEKDKFLLAVSGGSDSMALALLFKKFKIPAAIAYIDHGIRKQAEKENEFVRRFAQKNNFLFFTEKADVPAFAKKEKKSLEDAARILRYRMLAKICKKHGYKKIATAHTSDDLVETFFLRIFRGGGLTALKGIEEKTTLEGVEVIRPLLGISRSELKKFLSEQKQKFLLDETNNDLQFLRNKIRHKLIPYIEKNFDENIVKRILTLSKQAADLNNFVKQSLKKKKKNILEKKEYLRYNPFLRKCLLAEILEGKVNAGYIDKIDNFIASGKGGVFHIKDGIVKIKKGRICFEKAS